MARGGGPKPQEAAEESAMARRLHEEGALRGELLHSLMTAEGADAAAAASRLVLTAKNALVGVGAAGGAGGQEEEALLALALLRFCCAASSAAEGELSPRPTTAAAAALADDLERCSPFAAAFLRELRRCEWF